ncbi:SRPBCC domain-containing protein [Paenibacillus sp. FSL K6-0276]|uniref:SRPBCC domain-containing protein n=1 Tax=Paenibacillus sp. FSL K6-0276 TaxID=2921450 RepID=UPI0030EB81FA
MDTQVTTKFKIFKTVNEVFEAIIDPEKMSNYWFSWGGSDQETVVTITLTELEPASTVIEVNESGLRENDPEIVNKMIDQKEGWVYVLTCLKAYLENGVHTLRASLLH